MNLDEAITWAKARPITAWMAVGVIEWNDGYVVVTGEEIRRHPGMKLLYIRCGEDYPNSPSLGPTKTLVI